MRRQTQVDHVRLMTADDYFPIDMEHVRILLSQSRVTLNRDSAHRQFVNPRAMVINGFPRRRELTCSVSVDQLNGIKSCRVK